MKLNLSSIVIALSVGSVVACSPISGRDFSSASPYHKLQYCKSEKTSHYIFDAPYDARCERYINPKKINKPLSPIDTIIHSKVGGAK